MGTLLKPVKKRLKAIFRNNDIKYSLTGILAAIILSTVLLSLNIVGKTHEYNVGDIAREDIRVPRDVYYQNDDETKMKIKRLQNSVPVVFDRDASVLLDKLRLMTQFFGNLNAVLEENPFIGTDDPTFQLIALKNKLPRYLIFPDEVLVEFIKYKNRDELKKVLDRIFIYIYDGNHAGIIEQEFPGAPEIPNDTATIRTVNSVTETDESTKSLNEIITLEEMKNRIDNICYSTAPNLPASVRKAAAYIVRNNLKGNLKYNAEETRRRISEKSSDIKPVMNVLKKGQTLVREGDTITPDILSKIQIHNRHTRSLNFSHVAGVFILQLVFMLIFGYFILEYQHILIPDSKSTTIIISMIALFMLYAFFVSRSETVMNYRIYFILLLPIPFVTMIISILYNIYLAMLVGLGIVFFSSMLAGGDISTIIFAFSSAVLGVFINANVERRTDFLRGGFFLGLINSIILISVTLIDDVPIMMALKNMHLVFASGIINSILVLGILPLYENIFGITTKFKLLELSDLNVEIFKEMLLKAPGTYNHSLIVSTMAEAACKEIHANHLLARVGAFYHDIGKINDSGMYIENRVTDPRAKKLNPKQYSSLIISHVEKGVNLAKSQNLPQSVIDFITEHHGNSIMTFFYHQALEEASLSGRITDVKRTDFQYPGPKPRSKETAIVMLADAVEASSRSLHEPDQQKLEGMVRKIIYNRLNEGDLEFSDLSMTDLKTIEEAFMTILSGIFHTRIEYPDRENLKELEKQVEKKSNGRKKSK